MSVISSIFIVRFLGVEVIGKVAYYYGLIGMMTLFSDLGSGTAYMKFIASDEPDQRDVSAYFYIKISLIAVFCLIVWISFRWFYKPTLIDKTLFIIAFTITLFDLVSQIFINTLSGRRDFIYLSRVEIAGSVTLFIYNISVCLFFPNIYLLALNMAIVPLCVSITGIHYFIRHRILFYKIPGRDILFKYFRYAYPIAFSSVVGLFMGHFEKVVLGKLIGMKELGFYRLALGIFSGFDMVIKPVTNTLFTELSYRVSKSTDFIRTKFGDLVHTMNMIGGLLAILLLFGSGPVVEIFYGVENMRAAIILQCFSLSIISRLFWRPYRHILFAVEAHHPIAYLSVLEVILRLGLYYLLIPLNIKGVLMGALALPLTEFILWIIPSGIYNIMALLERFDSIHLKSIFFRISLPLGSIVLAGILLNFSLYLFPVFLILFLSIEYYLKVLNRDRWNSILLPLRDFFHFS